MFHNNRLDPKFKPARDNSKLEPDILHAKPHGQTGTWQYDHVHKTWQYDHVHRTWQYDHVHSMSDMHRNYYMGLADDSAMFLVSLHLCLSKPQLTSDYVRRIDMKIKIQSFLYSVPYFCVMSKCI